MIPLKSLFISKARCRMVRQCMCSLTVNRHFCHLISIPLEVNQLLYQYQVGSWSCAINVFLIFSSVPDFFFYNLTTGYFRLCKLHMGFLVAPGNGCDFRRLSAANFRLIINFDGLSLGFAPTLEPKLCR